MHHLVQRAKRGLRPQAAQREYVKAGVQAADIALMRNDTHLSGVYQNDTSIGQKAIDLIIDMIHRGERGLPAVPTRILVESTWRDGQTLCRQVPTAKKKTVAHAR